MGPALRIYREDAERMGKRHWQVCRTGGATGAAVVLAGQSAYRQGNDAPVDNAVWIEQCRRLELQPGMHAFEILPAGCLGFTGLVDGVVLVAWFPREIALDAMKRTLTNSKAAMASLIDEIARRTAAL